MASGADRYSILFKEGREDQPKAKAPARYWKGRVPDQAVRSDDEDEEEDQALFLQERREIAQDIVRNISMAKLGEGTEEEGGSHLNKRLQQFAEKKERQIRRTVVLEEEVKEEMSEKDARAMKKKRALEQRRKQLEKKAEAQEKLRREERQAREQREARDEEEEPQEAEEVRYKPVFVPKEERVTIAEREKAELEEKAREEAAKARREELQEQTQVMVETAVQREQELKKLKEEGYDSEGDLPDDEVKEEEKEYEYEQWRLRELGRIKREKEERLEREIERKEIERRRALTQEERELEDMKLGTDASQKQEGQKYEYMQKYYKLGRFFQERGKDDKSHIYNRDYNAPTAMDKVDKSGLPSVLQKRRGEFGKKGQTKWTHLSDMDTTQFDRNFMTPSNIHERQKSRMAGYKSQQQLDRPSYKRRL